MTNTTSDDPQVGDLVFRPIFLVSNPEMGIIREIHQQKSNYYCYIEWPWSGEERLMTVHSIQEVKKWKEQANKTTQNSRR